MENRKTETNVKLLDSIIRRLVEVLREFSLAETKKAESGQQLNQLQHIATQFLDRTIASMFGIQALLPSYSKHHVAIFPMGLILRSIFSDFITLLYLLSFTKRGTEINNTFLNEIQMLDRDFVRAYIEIKKLEGDLDQYMAVLPDGFKGREAIETEIDGLKTNELKSFFRKNKTLKSATELRHNSDPLLFYSQEAFKKPENTFMTDSYKWNQVKSDSEVSKFILAYHSYKIFSSFQHYSVIGHRWLTKGKEAFLFMEVILGVDAIFLILDFVIQLIDKKDSNHLLKLNSLKQELNKILDSKK